MIVKNANSWAFFYKMNICCVLGPKCQDQDFCFIYVQEPVLFTVIQWRSHTQHIYVYIC